MIYLKFSDLLPETLIIFIWPITIATCKLQFLQQIEQKNFPSNNLIYLKHVNKDSSVKLLKLYL